ncbi:hypothetical protein C7378_3133 [Acidipila rosea]|uniref:Uncharacterized protein n=1 Tax=Acidipila rosea TaxID=768535 RepID=A0A4R1KYX1_9BACT|nr:hypothetical protein C7378_3133 [Acidipila rosea]
MTDQPRVPVRTRAPLPKTSVSSRKRRDKPRCPLLAKLLVGMLLLCLSPAALHADEPLFGFSYTTDLLPKGKVELEQWSTTRFHKAPGGQFWLQENRTEQEYGFSDRLQLAIYETYDSTAAYHNGPFGETTPAEQFSYYTPGPNDRFNATKFIGVSGEAIYRLVSPYTHPLGFAIYEEPTFGAGFIESESKLIFQKNYRDDRLVLAANMTYAPEWRRLREDENPSRKEIQEETDANIDLGASYRFIRNWSAAFEIFNEREFNSYNFTHESNSGYYLGPTLHYAGKNFFVTTNFDEQMPWAGRHVDTVPGALVGGRIIDNDFEKYRVRVKFGWYF